MATKIAGNKGVWFKFSETDPESGEICVRPVDQETGIRILKDTMNRREVMRNGKREFVEERDTEKLNRLTYDFQIVDWKGLEDEDGNPIPCTTDNKVMYMATNNKFREFVSDCVSRVDVEFDLARERISKN